MANGNGNNELIPSGADPAISYRFANPDNQIAPAPQFGAAPQSDFGGGVDFTSQSQPSARYISPREMAGTALTTLAGRAASGIYEGIVKPIGQVFTGELTPSMEPGPGLLSVPEYAGNLALNALGARGLGFAAPEGSLGMFIGARGARYQPIDVVTGSNRVSDLNHAISLENAGYDRQYIFDETRWHRNPVDPVTGVGGEWAMSLPDTGARLKTENMTPILNQDPYLGASGGQSYTTHQIPFTFGHRPLRLEDILEHTDLYDVYPWLKGVKVQPLARLPGENVRGSFNPYSNTISLAEARDSDMLSTLLHEIQHAIQVHEGWARGGGVGEFLPQNYSKQLDRAMIESDAVKGWMKNNGHDPDKVAAGLGIFPYNAPMDEHAGKVLRVPDDIINKYIETQGKLKLLDEAHQTAVKKYLSMAGEVQARTTQEAYRTGVYDKLPEQIGEYEAYHGTGGRGRPYTPAGQQIIMYDSTGKAFSAEPVFHDPFAEPLKGGGR